jgi:ZIP family zinc transporter
VNAVLLSLVTLFSTSAGGYCAFRLRDRLHWLLALTAGVLLGVVVFDLLPESLALARQVDGAGFAALAALAAGFLLLHGFEAFLSVHSAHPAGEDHHHPNMGVFSAVALIGHSFFDGVGIGLAFQLSDAVGFTVAAAVIAHDFCDGLNTVSVMLLYRNPTRRTLFMLALSAIAPVLGAASTLAFSVPSETLVLYPGFLAGFLLYIAIEILPQAHARAAPDDAANLIGLTVLGLAIVYVVLRVAG